ncbi:uncharacterized protein TNCV_3046431 [Trichonephila clavipes]|uniref:Uncharacterized protein n=1 Tax=Trichonephila clavipes TaxID=2585209 RepID=A0A8X6UW43_TRICX|nr:uncharacterized protein TNCV_3046431 [Trichonephila clavipes]
MGDILYLKAFAYNISTLRTEDCNPKHNFCDHGTPKQMYMLFQNDVTKDSDFHGSNLNVHICSVTLHNPPPNAQSCTTDKVRFNDVLLVVTATWRSPYEIPAKIRLQAKPRPIGKYYTSPLLWRPKCMFSTPG